MLTHLELKKNLNFLDLFGKNITVSEAVFSFSEEALFFEGTVSFADFDYIINNEGFNFDMERTKQLEDGNILVVNKPVHIKCCFSPYSFVELFGTRSKPQTTQKILEKELKKNSELFLADNWLAMTLSQKQGEKTIGHQTLWNKIDFSTKKLHEKWEELEADAMQNFKGDNYNLSLQGEFGEEENSDEEAKKFFQMLEHALKDSPDPEAALSRLMEENDPEMVARHISTLLGNLGEISEDTYFDEMVEFLDALDIIEDVDEEREIVYLNTEMNFRQIPTIVERHDAGLVFRIDVNIKLLARSLPKLYQFMCGVNASLMNVRLAIFEEEDGNNFVILGTSLYSPDFFDEEIILALLNNTLIAAYIAIPLLEKLVANKITPDEAIAAFKDEGMSITELPYDLEEGEEGDDDDDDDDDDDYKSMW